MAKKNNNYNINDLAIAVAKGFEEVNKNFDKKFDQTDQKIDSVKFELSKKIEDEIKSVKVEISFGLREVKEEIKHLEERIDKNRTTAVKDIDELVEKVVACELDISKLKQKIAKLKLANS